MKVVLSEGTILAGPDGTGQAGDTLEVDEKFGKDLMDGGYADLYVAPEVAAEAAPLAAGLMVLTKEQLGAIMTEAGLKPLSKMTKVKMVEALMSAGIDEAPEDERKETPPAETATAPSDGEENAAVTTSQPGRTRTPTGE